MFSPLLVVIAFYAINSNGCQSSNFEQKYLEIKKINPFYLKY
ncbi:Hypothetical protein Minf_1291 [Methylacidiphilum infernorum V4]|uniref:Uncharacterized protein n=1 Tax=Methylacidiphilum infernorum (isolate V4) TaxID=481448 RepID=B3DVJ2_METI4|nr:Hypothetical protein Minf_1291 [Methylacidiphilum infernorum V4]